MVGTIVVVGGGGGGGAVLSTVDKYIYEAVVLSASPFRRRSMQFHASQLVYRKSKT